MLTEWRHSDSKRHAGIETPKSNAPSGKEHEILESETNSVRGNEGNTTKRRQGKGRKRALFSKKLSRRHDQRQEMRSVTPQLLRTISTHHLECNDYVLPDEVTSDKETSKDYFSSRGYDSSKDRFSSQGSDFSAASKPVLGGTSEACRPTNTVDRVDYNLVGVLGDHSVEEQAGLEEKFIESKESLSNQKNVDAKERELPGTESELLLKILVDQNYVCETFLQRHHNSSTEKALIKPGSFSVAGSSSRKAGPSRLNPEWKESELFVDQEMKFQVGNSPSVSSTMDEGDMAPKAATKFDIMKSESATHELKSQSHRFKDIKKRLEDIINKNNEEMHRISMGGILHKVPYGQKVTEHTMQGQLRRSASARYFRDIPREKIEISANGYLHRNIPRSRSLSVSLDRYSHLLESISVKESKRLAESLKSAHEDSDFQDKKTPKTFGRIFSSPEFFRSHSFPKYLQSEANHAEPLPEVSTASSLDSDVRVNIHDSLGPEPVETLLHSKQLKESDTFTAHSIDINVNQMTGGSLEYSLLMNEHGQGKIGKVSYSAKMDASHISLYEQQIGTSKLPVLISEHGQNEMRENSDTREESTGYISLHHQENGTELDPPDKRSPISVLDSFLEENPVASAKYLISRADRELEPRGVHGKELDSSPTAENPLDANLSNRGKITKSSSGEKEMRTLTHVDSFHIPVDQQELAEFNYVLSVLKETSFVGEDFLGRRYSAYQHLDLLPLREVDGLPGELGIATYDHETSLDHKLLFDLINEVLLAIVETSFAGSPWLSCFGSRDKPMAVGHHLLREVWAKISWHLSSQKQLNRTIKCTTARDFAKDDGWLNLRRDAECEGM